ncbi:MAG: PKD domain-containing protein [Bacteroidia bacterium]|nr:PKD domain-containing protein [Bacteroidia bacterium]
MGQINAAFSANVTSGCSPLVVQFTDLSTGNPTSWSWNFGNGNTSTLKNPGAVFVNPGTYTISLTASAGAASDVETKVAYITVFAVPTSNFQATPPLSGCAKFTTSFQDISTPGSGTINQWLWDFGDGTQSTLQNPPHTFPHPGQHTITLYVTDDNGCSDGFTIPNYINVLDTPVSAFSANPHSGCNAPFTANFNNTSTGTVPLSYQWSFGDGGTSTTGFPSHTYTNSGNYTVSLITTNLFGCTDTLVRPNYIGIGNITADFVGSPLSGCIGTAVSFTDLTSGGVGAWTWNFGDGGTSFQQNPIHVYNTPGVYNVTLTASNGPGCTNQVVKSGYITIHPQPGIAFTADSTSNCSAPFTVHFTDTSNFGGQWFWNFGDGSTSTAQNPTHQYVSPGNYSVSLIVITAAGCTDTISKTNYIKIVEPIASFPIGPQQPTFDGCAPLTVNFFENSYSVEPIVSYFWDFGDGFTSTQQYPTHVYQNAGVYTVTLTITNSKGCTSTYSVPGYVAVGNKPTAAFQAAPLLVCASEFVQFQNQSIGANAYFWDFGNGGSTATNPQYSFGDTGCFDVTLIALHNGCGDTTTIQNYVCNKGPVAKFVVDKDVICSAPGVVYFTETGYLDDTWHWDFGDGSFTTVHNPGHVYFNPGTYNVQLTVSNISNGCVDSVSLPIYVSGLVADFTAYPTSGCAPLDVMFVNQSTNSVWTDWRYGTGDDTTKVDTAYYTYTQAGRYWDTLIVKDNLGCFDTLIKPKDILVMDPKANFVASDTSECSGLAVQFTDLSTSIVPIVLWQWQFGDGTTSNQQNPAHSYVAASYQYTVSLSIVDSGGCPATRIRPNYISVTEPQVNFSQSDTIACPGIPIYFSNLSTGISLSYFWTFGDGSTSTSKDPHHSYANTGVYTVSLTITDINGCDTTLTKPALITIENLVANFGAAPVSAPCPPLLTFFTDSSSWWATDWQWDFGDGTGSTLPSPSHLYATAGVFDVTLIVKNNQGCTDTMHKSQLIHVDGPSGSFSFAPFVGCLDLPVHFEAITNNTAFMIWDMGDGTVVNTTVDSITHLYTQEGVFHPILILNDGQGCAVSLISPDSVRVDSQPRARFTASTGVICTADSVFFGDISVSASPVVAWHWDFGDGSTSNLQNPVHYYANPGSYQVTLAIENAFGCVDTVTKANFLTFGIPPVAAFQILDTLTWCQPFELEFQDQSSALHQLNAWTWDFGDGGSSVQQHPVHSYGQSGGYSIQLIVEDTLGCQDSASLSFLAPTLPSAAFSLVDSMFCGAPFLVNFNASTQNFVAWNWQFGDGNTGTGSAITHNYLQPGYYTPTLITEDIFGCFDTLTKANKLFSGTITPDFSWNPGGICLPLPVHFTDLSLADTTMVSWQWNFGNGSTSTQQNPTSSYPNPGTYGITLIVTDAIGCKDTLFLNGLNIDAPPRPFVPTLKRVSVESDNSISLKWQAYSGPHFDHYVIYRENPALPGTFMPIDSVFAINTLNYLDQNGLNCLNQSYCYRLVVVDSCGQRSSLDSSRTHCSIDLEVTPAILQTQLNWSPYLGWDSVAAYEIYRVIGYSNNNNDLLATVSGNTLTWTDPEIFCFEPSCYRVKAIEAGGFLEYSWSDTSCGGPIDPDPPLAPEMVQATVESNQYVRLNWLPAADPAVVSFGLQRSVNQSNWQSIGQFPVNQTTYLDQNVLVNDYSYYYQLFTIDSCQVQSPISNLSRSILLQAELKSNAPELTWNTYQTWSQGIEKFEIEVFNEGSQSWQFVGTVDGNTLFYRDVVTRLSQSTYCYRVRALENQGNLSFSLSNQACVPLPGALFAPNAFTPNGDGINDEFLLVGKFIEDFHLEIFDRWGQLLFVSDKLDSGWNGTYHKEDCQEGVYVFVARAVDNVGKHFQVRGSVTLIR